MKAAAVLFLPFRFGVGADDICDYIITSESLAPAAVSLILNFTGSDGEKIGSVDYLIDRRDVAEAVIGIGRNVAELR